MLDEVSDVFLWMTEANFSHNPKPMVGIHKRHCICHARFSPDPEGGFCAYAVNLPGVAEDGDSYEEARDNLKDAFQAVIQTYLESGQPIPWKIEEEDRREGWFDKSLAVDV